MELSEFRDAYCCGDTTIEFLGLFDTVYGVYWGSQHRNLSHVFFKNRLLGHHVKVAVHLLARIVLNNEAQGVFEFAPTRWWGNRIPNELDQCQSIHPIYKVLEGRSFITKKQNTNFFRTPKFPFATYASVKSLARQFPLISSICDPANIKDIIML